MITTPIHPSPDSVAGLSGSPGAQPNPATVTDTGPGPVPPQPPISNGPPAASAASFAQFHGESDRAFEAFRAYLELGPRRRFAAVGRKVGVSLRTIMRWAGAFDWRGRIKACAAQLAGEFCEIETTVHRADCLDAAARAKAFRDRQYTLAESLLDAAERFLENVDPDDLDQLSFSDACKALAVASRLGQLSADANAADASSAPARGLREQLMTLLDQAYGSGSPAPAGADNQPSTPQPAQL